MKYDADASRMASIQALHRRDKVVKYDADASRMASIQALHRRNTASIYSSHLENLLHLFCTFPAAQCMLC